MLLGREAFLEHLLRLKHNKKTLPQITERLNRALRELVREYDRQHSLVRERHPVLADVEEGRASSIDAGLVRRIAAELAPASSALDRAYWTLRHIGTTDRQAKHRLEDSRKYLHAGNLDMWEPITPKKVENALSHWEESPKRRAYLAALNATVQNARSKSTRDGASRESRKTAATAGSDRR